MEPFSGLMVVAGVAGLTKAFSSNTERIVQAIEQRLEHHHVPAAAPDRVVIVETVRIESSSDQVVSAK